MFDTLCKYCKHFAATRRTGKVKKGKVYRRCPVKARTIHSERSACDYFGPANIFHCDMYEHQLAFANCLHRRGNRLDLKEWDDCKKCRQFEKELKGLFMEFFIEARKPITPYPDQIEKPKESVKKNRTIKRRRKSPLTKALDELLPEPEKRRSIKRRKPARRKLKRRVKK